MAALTFANQDLLFAVGREWENWSKQSAISKPDHTEALRFFSYLLVERPDLIDLREVDAAWPVIYDYLRHTRAA